MMCKKNVWRGMLFLAAAAFATGCDKQSLPEEVTYEFSEEITLDNIARLLSSLPLGTAQVTEVYDAVTASSDNGYDEEYLMRDLLESPGGGVGDDGAATKAGSYSRPLRSMIADFVSERFRTKAGGTARVQAYLDSLAASSVQIYWPYSEDWDGKTLPVITFDPGSGAEYNIGYRIVASDTATVLQTVIVNEAMAMKQPVWVVNSNEDAHYKSLAMLRREDPSWGTGGGTVTKSAESRTLYLRSFNAQRNYDPWFAGASEFFVKCGSVEDFSASTDAELALYTPSVTDFMIVVKRKEVQTDKEFNVVLVSDWTDQLENCAFLITEDDGGTRTNWKCSATVKYNSKSYGFDMQLPLNSRDDIVWRGQLSSRYIERYAGKTGHFGGVDLVLDLE